MSDTIKNIRELHRPHKPRVVEGGYKYLDGLDEYYVLRLIDRFWKKVDRRGEDECWGWVGARQPRGYGSSSIKGKPVGAHCLSYELNIGPIGDENVVTHLCDNPNCVNPRHLMSATASHNTNDCITKGRWVKGRKKRSGALSRRQLQVVKRLAMSGGAKAIASDLNISPQTVFAHIAAAQEALGVRKGSKINILLAALRHDELSLNELVAPPHVLRTR